MTNPPPLSVDPERLGTAGGELLTSAGQLPTAPPPFMPVGTDPLSVAIIEQIPGIELPVMTQLPMVQAQSTQTATNVVGAARAYAATDQQLGGDISKEMQNPAAASGLGSGGGSGADAMSQMMSMPMQMASQMAQMPGQVMGAAAALPQGAMQGVQQVGQQVSQMTGQFGGGGGQPGGVGAQSSSGGQPGGAGGSGDVPGAELPEAEREDDRDGAAAGEQGERAPEDKNDSEKGAQDAAKDSHAAPPGRHRRADVPAGTDEGINL